MKNLINSIVDSWQGLPDADRECLASFITTMHNAILSPEFNQFITDAAAANSQEELQAVGMEFAGVVQNKTCENPF